MDSHYEQQILIVYPKHQLPYHNPSGNPILVDYIPNNLRGSFFPFGNPEWRTVNIRLLRWSAKRIRSKDFVDDTFYIGKEELRQACLSDREFCMIKKRLFGDVITKNMATGIAASLRKRSGGKDPLTGRNKQTLVKNCYRFFSVYDVFYAMYYQISLWLPWYMEKYTGNEIKAEDVTWDDIVQEVEFMIDQTDKEVWYDYMLNLTPMERDNMGLERE